MPLVDVAATLITHGDRILAVYNPKWGSFTLPMSKRRSWENVAAKEKAVTIEDWEDTAVRAAAEWLGCTVTQKPEFLLEAAEFQQSDRDAKWKRYRLQAFKVTVDDPAAVQGGNCEWLSVDELLDENRRPISPTARYVIAELRLEGKV